MSIKNELYDGEYFYYINERIYSDNNGVDHMEYVVFRYVFYADDKKSYRDEFMFKTQESADLRCFELNSLYGY